MIFYHLQSTVSQEHQLPVGHRLESHSRHFDAPKGSLSITALKLLPQPTTDLMPLKQDLKEKLAGTLKLLTKTKNKRNIKIRAFFVQQVLSQGTLSISPVLSFHAIIPDDSKVFQLIKHGDLQGLKQILQDGEASLTDRDTLSRSLLGVRQPQPI